MQEEKTIVWYYWCNERPKENDPHPLQVVGAFTDAELEDLKNTAKNALNAYFNLTDYDEVAIETEKYIWYNNDYHTPCCAKLSPGEYLVVRADDYSDFEYTIVEKVTKQLKENLSKASIENAIARGIPGCEGNAWHSAIISYEGEMIWQSKIQTGWEDYEVMTEEEHDQLFQEVEKCTEIYDWKYVKDFIQA